MKLIKAFDRYLWIGADEANKQALLAQVEPVSGRLLDLGAGSGELTLRAKVAARAETVYALEIEPVQVKELKLKGFKVAEHDLNHPLPYRDNFFDTIIANQVIEHLYFTDDFIKEVHRVLKPGAQLIISTTNLAAWHYRMMLLLGQQPVCLHPATYHFGNLLRGHHIMRYGHKSVFTHRAFVEFLEYYGFEVKSHFTTGFHPFPSSVSRFLLRLMPNFGTYSSVICRKKINP